MKSFNKTIWISMSLILMTVGLPVFSAFGQGVQIGVVGAVSGTACAVSSAGDEKDLRNGDAVYLDDQLITQDEARLQILLMDETVFTLGPSSSIKLDEFAYDPGSDDGNLKANVIQGVFRVISGKIAHKKPENMQVDLPAGSIGFRGTMVAGKSEGMRSLVALLGPEGRSGAAPGRIFVTNSVNGEQAGVEISERNFGTIIEGAGVAPLAPFKLSEAQLNELTGSLNLSMSGNAEAMGSSAASQENSDSKFDPQDMSHTMSLISRMGEFSQKAAQGGMLTPQPVIPVVVGGGRDEDSKTKS